MTLWLCIFDIYIPARSRWRCILRQRERGEAFICILLLPYVPHSAFTRSFVPSSATMLLPFVPPSFENPSEKRKTGFCLCPSSGLKIRGTYRGYIFFYSFVLGKSFFQWSPRSTSVGINIRLHRKIEKGEAEKSIKGAFLLTLGNAVRIEGGFDAILNFFSFILLQNFVIRRRQKIIHDERRDVN